MHHPARPSRVRHLDYVPVWHSVKTSASRNAERESGVVWDDCGVNSLRLLNSPDGRHVLDSLPDYDAEQTFALIAQLRSQGHSPELVSAALTQSRLRSRATAKFGSFAHQMLFTADGLEQSTRLDVGVHHAQRLRAAGASCVLDVGCGIGADSMAFAGLGLGVRAVEMNPEAAAAARWNLAAFPEAVVIEADALAHDLHSLGADALWLDPARRSHGRRINDPEKWMPALSTAIALARQFPAAGIKVAPGVDYANLPADSHVQWISVDGDLLEAVIWLGAAAPHPGRSALVLGSDGAQHIDANVSHPRERALLVEPRPLGPYVYEPDPALIRSGAIGWLCAEYGLAPVSPAIAYLTGEERIESAFMRGFAVETVLALNAKQIRAHLIDSGVGTVEIKKRGVDIDPETLRKKLKLDRSLPGSATIIMTPLLGQRRAICARRI